MIRDAVIAAAFEIKMSFKKMSTYVYFFLFLALAITAAYAMGGGIEGAVVNFGFSERVFINSPISILTISTLFTAFGSSIIAAAFGQAVCKDYLANFDQVIYSKPIGSRPFLLGRFFGTLAIQTLIFCSLPLGIWIAVHLPGIQANLITSTPLWQYFQPVLISLLPNIFIFGAIYFLLASMTKKMAPVYMAGVLTLMGWMLAGTLLADIDNKTVATLIDPFGLSGIDQAIKYWSVDQKQHAVLWWTSYYFTNRWAWLALGFAALGHAIFRFKPLAREGSRRGVESATTAKAVLPRVTKSVSRSPLGASVLWAQVKLELRQASRNIYFLTLSLAAILHVCIASSEIGKMFGTNTYPVTRAVIQILDGMLGLYMLILITFWSGELVWRDRETRFSQIVDATPSSTLSLLIGKVITVNLITTFFLVLFMLVGIAIQTIRGYHHYELGLYAFDLFGLNFLKFFFLSSLAIFFQTVTPGKYYGHGLMILFYLYRISAALMGWKDVLLIPGGAPLPPYSDMNGHGHFLYGYFSFQILWTLLAVILLMLSYFYWPRGTGQRDWSAWKTWPRPRRRALATAILAFGGMGAFVFYNTHILNEYSSTKRDERLQADYEIKYKSYFLHAMPITFSVFPKVDLYPHQQALHAEVMYQLTNESKADINEIFLNVPFNRNYKYTVRFDRPVELAERNDSMGVLIYKFKTPLHPGDSMPLYYVVDVTHPGFSNENNSTAIVDNGTFVHNTDYFPTVGYDSNRELQSTKTRAKYGLKENPRMPDLNDKLHWNETYISTNSHWVDFETVVSTSVDQIAIAPGYLVKEWTDRDRHYYHYKMDRQILDFYAFVSGKYAIKKDKWHDVDIEVFYYPEHTQNINTMINATKDGLEYFSKVFTPYQYRQFRIIEFPLYAEFAQSFPNTVPFSEGLGFIAKVDPRDPKDFDYPYYVTAHELAHQWWAHQVIGANVQGATMLSESLAQYSAILLLEHHYDGKRLKNFFKHELNSYLEGRGSESKRELPLYRNENQGYIHYNKASLLFYQLKNRLGEESVNSGIRNFALEKAFTGPPFPRSTDLIRSLNNVASMPDAGYMHELFEKIELYDLRPVKAQVSKLPDGGHKIHFEVDIKKYLSDENGKEELIPDINEPFEVGAYNAKGDLIYNQTFTFKSGISSVDDTLKEAPVSLSIDPRGFMIDKNPSDNEMKVTTM